MSTFEISFQHYNVSSSQKNWGEKKKCIKIEKEKVRLTLFADNMIVYRENIKKFTCIQQILHLSIFSTGTG